MDKEIFSKCKKCTKPFDDLTLYTDGVIELSELRLVVKEILNDLEVKGYVGKSIYKVWDWIEHDSFLPKKKEVKSEFLSALLQDDQTFYDNHSGDTYVNIGIFDPDERWYLRIYIVDDYDLDEGESRSGRFALSLCKESNLVFDEYLKRTNSKKLLLSDTAKYFERII